MQGVLIRQAIRVSEVTAKLFYFRNFRFHFGGVAGPCWAFSFVDTACPKKKIIPSPGYGMRRPSCFPRWSMDLLEFANGLFAPNCLDCLCFVPFFLLVSERSGRNPLGRKAYVASELIIPEACRRDPCHPQVTSLQLQS